MAKEVTYPIPDVETAISRMKLFNHQVDKLLGSSFWSSVKKGSTVKLTAKLGQPVDISRKGATEEEIQFALTNVRLFMLDNDKISYNVMSQIEKLDEISEKWKTEFRKHRDLLNGILDVSTGVNHNGSELINRELLDVCIYGWAVHLNKHDEYQRRMENMPILKPTQLNVLEGILIHIIGISNFIKEENLLEIERLS